ncbi:RYamide receptor [Eurytemora carolleeae]|uniref:RYamide receptor n=1 Tax=Eurytemora carolleeae TaxID=1294199 RepID=UPI000C76589D|nr:RYamide receptor [Eurytemora carolleeae]|eukprot:XP_023337479.1 RYamide receptor-like [Eurytemora affinis]
MKVEERMYMTHPQANLSESPLYTVIDNETFCLDFTLRAYIHCFFPVLGDLPNRTWDNGYEYCLNSDLEAFVICDPIKPPVYKVPLSIILVLSLCYGAISLLSILGNTFIIYVIVISRRMQTVTNMYIANLAFADVILAVFCIPFQFRAALVQRWDLPEFMCKFCPLVQIVSRNTHIYIYTWTLVAICLDRHKAIIYPLATKQTKSNARLVILGIWLMAILTALPVGPAYSFEEVLDLENGGMKPFCAVRGSSIEINKFGKNLTFSLFQVYCTFLVVIEYLIPLGILTAAYINVGQKLWGAKTPGQAHVVRDDRILKNKKKVIKMLITVVVVFAVCWLPYQSYFLINIIHPPVNQWKYINILFFCFHWLAMSNSCYNPFIYGIFSEKFKREYRLRLSCLNCFTKNNNASPGGSDFDVPTANIIPRAPATRYSIRSSVIPPHSATMLSLKHTDGRSTQFNRSPLLQNQKRHSLHESRICQVTKL